MILMADTEPLGVRKARLVRREERPSCRAPCAPSTATIWRAGGLTPCGSPGLIDIRRRRTQDATMRIATYTRISTDEELQPYSLEAQAVRLGPMPRARRTGRS